MSRAIEVKFLGDPASLVRAVGQSSTLLAKFGGDADAAAQATVAAAVKQREGLAQLATAYEEISAAAVKGSDEQIIAAQKARDVLAQLGITAKETADETVAAAQRSVAANVEQRDALRALLAEYTAIGAAAAKGSDEQIAANQLAADSARKLGIAYTEAGAAATRSNLGMTESGFGRGATSKLSGLGGWMAGPGFIAGAALGLTIDKSIKATLAERAAVDQLDQALRNAHANVTALTPILDKYTESARKAGFADEDTRKAEMELVQAFGATKQSLDEVRVAEDLARAKKEDLATATQQLILLQEGNTRAAKQFGLALPDLTTAQWRAKAAQDGLSLSQEKGKTLYDELLPRIKGQAQAYANSPSGKIAEFQTEVQKLEETIGSGLLPSVDKYLTRVDDWLSKTPNQQRVTHDVQTVISDLATALETAYHATEDVLKVADPVVHALGGWKTVLEAIIALKFASVLQGWVGPLKNLIGSSSSSGAASGLAGAESSSSKLLGHLKGLVALGGITVGVDLLYKSQGDKGGKGFFESLFGASLVGAGVGFQVGGPWGAGLGLAIGVSADIFEHLIKGGPAGYQTTPGNDIRDLGHGVYYSRAMDQYYRIQHGVQQAISANKAKAILGDSAAQLQTATAHGGNANPVPGGSFGRIDQGVDYQVKLVRAIRAGVIVSVSGGMAGPSGQAGASTIIKQRFSQPVDVNGRTYYGAYYSEGVALVQARDHVFAGDPVMKGGSVEVGFLLGQSLTMPPLKGGLGAATKPTQAGQDFNDLVKSIGGPGASTSPYGPSVTSGNTGVKGAGATKPHVLTGDNLIPEALRNAINKAKDTVTSSTTLGSAAKALHTEMADLDKARQLLEAKLKTAHGKEKAAIEQELRHVDSQIAGVNKAITSNLHSQATAVKTAFTSKISSQQAAIATAIGLIRSDLDQQLADQLTTTIAGLKKQYYQGTDSTGKQRQTPAEKALAKMQAADTAQGLQDTLTQDQAQLASDEAALAGPANETVVAKATKDMAGVTLGGPADKTISDDEKKIQQDERAITENELAIKATHQRQKADHEYAIAVGKATREEKKRVKELDAELATWARKLKTGHARLSDLNGIAKQFGLTLSDPQTGVAGDLDKLQKAVKTLAKIMREEASKLKALGDPKDAKKLTGQASALTVQQAATGGDIMNDGLIYVHAGERIQPAQLVRAGGAGAPIMARFYLDGRRFASAVAPRADQVVRVKVGA